jgi:hypothetical protein
MDGNSTNAADSLTKWDIRLWENSLAAAANGYFPPFHAKILQRSIDAKGTKPPLRRIQTE